MEIMQLCSHIYSHKKTTVLSTGIKAERLIALMVITFDFLTARSVNNYRYVELLQHVVMTAFECAFDL